MSWWAWLLAGAGGVATLWSGIKAVKEVFAPYAKMKKDLAGAIDKENKHKGEADSRFEKIEAAQKQQEATTQAMLQGLVALVNHEIDGNGIEGLKEARAELLNHIITR